MRDFCAVSATRKTNLHEWSREREKPRMGDARLLDLIPCEWGDSLEDLS